MSAKEWLPLIYGGRRRWRLVREPLEQLGIAPALGDVVDLALAARHALGLDGVLPVITTQDCVVRQFRGLLQRSRRTLIELERVPVRGTVLFPHFRGSNYLELLELFLAYRLRFEGFRSLFLACGGLPICNNFVLGQDAARNPSVCRRCRRNHGQLLRTSGQPWAELAPSAQELARAMESTRDRSVAALRALTYRGVPVGELVIPSVARHLRCTAAFASEPEEVSAWRKYVAAAMALVDRLEVTLAGLDAPPILAVMPGGWFLWYAVADFLLRRQGVQTVYYEAAFHDPPRAHRWMFSQGVPLTNPQWITPGWEEWRDRALSPAEDRHLDEALAARRIGSIYHPSPLEEVAVIRREVDVPDDGRPLVVLFTGITWDYAIYGQGSAAFRDMTDWVADTIRYLADRPVWVVVRIHPAEAILHEGVFSREHLAEVLHGRLGALPGNVRVVPAASKVSSYTLVDLASTVVVYASTIGLETAVAGRKPLVLASYSILSERGFGHQPANPGEYFALLDRTGVLPSPTEEEVTRARRFAYLYFFRTAWPLHFYESGADGLYSIDRVRIRSLEELRPGCNAHLDRVVQALWGRATFAVPRELASPPAA